MAAVPKISCAVSHYASHCLLTNVQFSTIEKYAVNANISIHNLYGSRQQQKIADEIKGGKG